MYLPNYEENRWINNEVIPKSPRLVDFLAPIEFFFCSIVILMSILDYCLFGRVINKILEK
ncbi:MAG: hypothetical protein ACI825_000284 [Planctomycetota bacterium]|jgi:hypothetical protein